MDDVTSKRIEGIAQDVAQLRQDLAAVARRVTSTETRVEQVHGDLQALRSEVRALAQQGKEHHAAQMRAFQDVIAEVRSARDAKIAELETAVAELRAQVAELLAGRH